MNKKIKITLITLIMVLICLIGFGGIYVQKKGKFKNIIPDYELGTKIEGLRETTFKIDDSTNEVIYDSEGNKVDKIPDGEDEGKYTKKDEPVNADENKTVENYKKAKEIMQKRLKSLGISNYEVRVDEETGNIYVETTENKNTDNTLAKLLTVGKFEMIDTKDKTLLMDSNDIEDVGVFYNTTTSGITTYLQINFTKEGKKKMEQVSKDYATLTATSSNENSEEKSEEGSSEESSENKQKTVTINIDGEEFLSTSFSQTVTNGELTISIGKASKDTDTISEYMTTAQQYATILGNGELPLTYKVESSEYMTSIYTKEVIYVVLGILAGIALISVIYMIIRYKTLGLSASIVYIASIAVLTLLIRYTGVQINIETTVSAVIILILMNYINCKLLKNTSKEDTAEERKKKLNQTYKALFDVVLVTLIPAIVLTYCSLTKLSNVGMTLFWGVITAVLMNMLFTKLALTMQIRKK